ncbi:MerR family transcriptional regulator [Halobacillus karajensis]|uniref:Methyltransferase YrrT n=1 Tax=Halobacillus karajensis TaxID=195088 RepID=A0A024P5A6_9BACI|nr:MerR family transcriptional regulator [Halobacillus karajensis]CDQ20563.1 putative methyltransferase YrrT [Halobacillus karajensis]CDQ23968.1 putative methyltransferase YrrT [Halobacillus karajensis]CDQ27446.1 putative methyltransferase YrrT [Halobacillus karajensis]
MKITEVARKLNTTPRTIRFYEEKGLVFPGKTGNGYRLYKEADVKTLQAVLALREVGMSTAEIKTALEQEGGVSGFLHSQRSALYKEMLQIRDMITALDKMIEGNEKDAREESMIELAGKLKRLKEKRANWQDRWNFDDQAEVYDQNIKTTGYRFNVHENYWDALQMIKEWVDATSNEQGVDIGTGTGNLTGLFIEEDIPIIAIDQSKEMLKMCKKKFPRTDTRHGHFLSLPLKDHEADFIVSSYALHHLPDDEKELALAEMDRILSDGGRIAIADLMFKNKTDKQQLIDHLYKTGNREAIDAIEDEYYAEQTRIMKWLENKGYKVQVNQLNSILHLLFARK